MQNIDPYSYQCGVIDCFNEMVRSGVKALALSHPMDSAAERDALIPFARSCCHQYGNQLYIEDTPLLTDLFPLSLNQGKFNILFYRAGHILDQYLRLKERKANLVAERAYFGGNRSQLAWEYGRLLSYPDEAIRHRTGSPQPDGRRREDHKFSQQKRTPHVASFSIGFLGWPKLCDRLSAKFLTVPFP